MTKITVAGYVTTFEIRTFEIEGDEEEARVQAEEAFAESFPQANDIVILEEDWT